MTLDERLQSMSMKDIMREAIKSMKERGDRANPDPFILSSVMTQRVNEEVGVINTKEIREHIERMRGSSVQLPGIVADMCDEIDELRRKNETLLDTNKTIQGWHSNLLVQVEKLTAEVARLREKCGEKVCSKCGKTSDTLHRVTLATHYEVVPPNVVVYLNVCRDCIINALAALRK